MQVFVRFNSGAEFAKAVNTFLESGYHVVPGTFLADFTRKRRQYMVFLEKEGDHSANSDHEAHGD